MAAWEIKDETERSKGTLTPFPRLSHGPHESAATTSLTNARRSNAQTPTALGCLPTPQKQHRAGSSKAVTTQPPAPRRTLPPLLGDAGGPVTAPRGGSIARPGKGAEKGQGRIRNAPRGGRSQPALLETTFPHLPTATGAGAAQSRPAARRELAPAAPREPRPAGHPPKLPGTPLPPQLPPARQVPHIRAAAPLAAEILLCEGFLGWFFFFSYYV